ncbi:DUF5994 family protein [Streptomyces sp. NRRL F-2664]|uniref:DUF5994 family protein n=1 Tax=Streptomyces sp. NRRL F-2664 TaxID=1463842 RepID=UPI0005BA0C74|nr:DUF5994 family protein [Streptomyces sp. NRRL F-2664]
MTGTASPFSVRLTLTPKTALAGLLDGAWWPRSRDLAAELPSLADALDARFGRITRLTASPTCWLEVPPRISVADGRAVQLGWFTEQDSDTMILFSYAVGRCDLLVIPPETEAAAAQRLMAAAALPGNVRAVATLMADEAATGRRIRDARSRDDSGESEGATASAPAGHPVVGARMIPLPWNMRR